MSPRQLAQSTWDADATTCFHRAEMLCLLSGVVISTPRLYVMAMLVDGAAPDDLLTDISRQARRMTPTPTLCHVWLAAGNIGELLSLLIPYPHITHISFQKRGYEIHRIPLTRIHRHGKRT